MKGLNEPEVFSDNGVKLVDEIWFVLDTFLNIKNIDFLFFGWFSQHSPCWKRKWNM